MLKIKYILPLILILLLTFTLIGDCWVDGYDQRIKLTIDHTKIDDTLSDFPATAFFTDAQAEEIFAEFDADEDFDRGQFALGDDTLLYAEKELFDDSESKAIYHVKIPSISSSVDTDYYFYYDNSADHNTTYIGATGTTAGENVWDSNFKAVYHMVDATISTILDSTSNSNDGTKKAANEPIEAAGKVGQGQDFSSDYIYHSTLWDTMPTNLTIESCAKRDVIDAHQYIFGKHNIESQDRVYLMMNADNKVYIWGEASNGGNKVCGSVGTVAAGTWYYVAGVHTAGSALKVYLDDVETTGDTLGTIQDGTYKDAVIGDSDTSLIEPFNGVIDEVRLSNIARSAAWLKATYNSLWDSLLTYGSEETKPSVTNIMFMFSNF